jgi:hypothetical protein
MSFISLGQAASKVVSSVTPGNVVLFPLEESGLTAEERLARASAMVDSAMSALFAHAGTTGAARIVTLLLEEKLASRVGDIVKTDRLAEKIAAIGALFRRSPAK